MEAAMLCKVNSLQCKETCGECNYRHHVEPRVQLCVPKEEPFPRPLKCIDVSRTTHTNLDVLQESRIDDCWSVDVDRSLSDSCTALTMFTTLNEKYPRAFLWSGGLHKFEQLPDLKKCGQRFGQACQKQLNEKKSSNGLSRNRRSTMRES